MGQMTVRQLDDGLLARLKARAKAEGTSAEALARGAIHQAARVLTPDEKRQFVLEMLEKGKAAMVPGAKQTPGWQLIRKDRDHGH